MAFIKVEAGDFQKSKKVSMFVGNEFKMAHDEMGWTLSGFKTTKYAPQDVEEIVEASEESVKRIGGTVGWGIAGAALLGPVGLLAGLLAGGRGKDVTFICKFKDGKKFLGTTDSKTFKAILASQFDL